VNSGLHGPLLNDRTLAGKLEVIDPRQLKFQKVQPDQALAPERQVVRDRLVAPLPEAAMGRGIGAGQFAWT
jgi:hypothetical protein